MAQAQRRRLRTRPTLVVSVSSLKRIRDIAHDLSRELERPRSGEAIGSRDLVAAIEHEIIRLLHGVAKPIPTEG
jgi:hypothetical protein